MELTIDIDPKQFTELVRAALAQKVLPVEPTTPTPPALTSSPDMIEVMSRETLVKEIEARGGKIPSRTRTTTLKKKLKALMEDEEEEEKPIRRTKKRKKRKSIKVKVNNDDDNNDDDNNDDNNDDNDDNDNNDNNDDNNDNNDDNDDNDDNDIFSDNDDDMVPEPPKKVSVQCATKVLKSWLKEDPEKKTKRHKKVVKALEKFKVANIRELSPSKCAELLKKLDPNLLEEARQWLNMHD